MYNCVIIDTKSDEMYQHLIFFFCMIPFDPFLNIYMARRCRSLYLSIFIHSDISKDKFTASHFLIVLIFLHF